MLKIDIITPFPEIVDIVTKSSILSRANKKNIVSYNIYNLFDFSDPPHNRIDDYPFGGGKGMILKPEPIFRAIKYIKRNRNQNNQYRIIFPTPDGKQFSQKKAIVFSKVKNIIFICGHYKGIDERIRKELITDEISIGDFILTGGELPAMVILDSIVRLIPGVLNSYESAESDSFMGDLLDHPHYTRPEEYKALRVPEVLLSGHHEKINDWRIQKREEKTKNIRPDLWKKYNNKKN
tara:strand:+ start:887 stop:1594 length:708 start_codon:yes stop_codon:yes gene_type:complete